MPSILDAYPLRVLINGEDFTTLTDEGLTFSNVDPGGYEACSIPIPRDCPELLDGQPIQIQCGLATVWEGRIGEVQRSLGNKTLIAGEGYGAELKENFMSEVYVDRDLTRWTTPVYQRQINMLTGFNKPLNGQFQIGPDPDNNNPALVLELDNSWDSPDIPVAEAWYDAGPENLIATLYLVLDGNVIGAGGNWTELANLSSDSIATSIETSGNLNSGGAFTFSPATALRYAFLQHFYNSTPAGANGAQYLAAFSSLAAYGNHGLPGRGSAPAGYYPSDIAQHALSQLPSGLIVPGIIPTFTTYIVPHYVQYVPVPIEQIMADMGGLAGTHWGTWETLTPLTGSPNPRFDFRPYPTTPTCFAFRQDCDTLDINEDLSGLYDSAQVTFIDAAGTQQAVYVTLDNPYLDEVGLHRTLQIDAGTSTATAAAVFGQVILELSQYQARAAGSATITGLLHTAQGDVPPFMLKSGIDRVRIPDLPGQNAFGTTNDFNISRVETSVSSDGITTNLELGQGPNLIEVLQARMQAASTLAAVL